MKKILLLLACLSFLQWAQAQDYGIFTSYNITPVLINPSAAGFEDAYQLQLNARSQWSGFVDAPTTYSAQFNGPLGDNFGIGVGVLSETAAQLQRVRGHLNYAFRFDVSRNVKLAAGFQTEYQQMSLDQAVLGNNLIDVGDQLLDDYMNGQGVFDAALSVFSSFGENTRVGLTFTNLVRSRMAEEDQDESILKYYMFFASHRLVVEDLNFVFEPSLLVRNVRHIPSQVEINLMARFFDEQLTTGLSYRSLGSLGILLGTKLGKFQFYYSYDVFFQEFQSYNNGSHEVGVLMSFERAKQKNNRSRRR